MPDMEKLLEVLDDLINKENIDRVLNEILKEMGKIAEKIQDIAEQNRIHSFKHGSIEVAEVQYKFGTGYVHRYKLYINGKTIPEKAENLGWDYHPYGDFYNNERHIDIDEIRVFVNEIEDFVNAFKEYVEEHRKELEDIKNQVAQISI